MDIINFYKEHTIKINLFILISIIIVIIAGYLLLPDIFYDQWIWKYYWGPIVSDAQSSPAFHNGIQAAEKYTIVSEITYGSIIIIVLYLLFP